MGKCDFLPSWICLVQHPWLKASRASDCLLSTLKLPLPQNYVTVAAKHVAVSSCSF